MHPLQEIQKLCSITEKASSVHFWMAIARRRALERRVLVQGKQLFSGGHAESIGKRPTMEDSCAIVGEFAGPGTQFYGVFDGHGGSSCAIYCSVNLPGAIADAYRASGEMADAISRGIKVVGRAAAAQWPFMGTTAAIIVVADHRIFCANVGDSRIVIIEKGAARRMSYDHVLTDPNERWAVVDRGGAVINNRVNGTLALSRAIGDGAHADSISAEPFMSAVDYDESLGVVIACDGVWDVMSDDEVAAIFVGAPDPGAAARAIKDGAIAKGSDDNVSVICVHFRPKE
jgi:serine/threonine protein phosphatase PrpC